MSFETVTVTWDETDIALVALGGSVTFAITAPLVDPSGQVAQPDPPKTYWFGSGTGTSDPLAANDSDGALPAGTAYLVTVAVSGEVPYTFTTQVLIANGATQTLGFLQANEAEPAEEYAQYLPLPTGTPAAGDVPTATADGSTATVWAPSGTGGSGFPATPVVSGTPSAGQVLTATSPTAASWQAPAGGGSGTVTSVTVESANGFSGTVADAATTPQVTVKTTVTGILKGNGTAVSAAAAGTDYLAPDGDGSQLTGITAAQAGADASGAAATAQSNAETYAAGVAGTAQASAETYAAAQASAAQSAAEAASDPAGSAATAQSNAETFATSAVGTETSRAEAAEALLAPKASPAFTGSPTAPTQTAGDDTTKLATTAYADAAVAAETSRAEAAEALRAPLASPALTGTPTAPTATALTGSTQVATTAYADAAAAAETSRAETAEALKAPLASPALTGSPTAPTQTTGDTSVKIATDAFVATAVAAEATRATGAEGTLSTAVSTETSRAEAAEALLAPLASPALTGTPTAPTAAALTSTTQLATTAYADSAVAAEKSRAQTAEALLAAKASPTFTGTPAAPTASPGTNTTQLATTAFAAAAASAAQSTAQGASLPVTDDLSAIATANATAANVPMNSKKLTGLANGSASTDSAAFGQIPVIDSTAGDIQPVGTAAAAGSKGQVADASHVHKGFAKLATTGTAGFALTNGTPTIISWTAPNDGAMHMFVCISTVHVTSAETGGTIQVIYQSPISGVTNHFTQAFAGGLGTDTNGQTGTTVFALVQPGTTVTVQQTAALTAGAATVYAELWGN